MNRGKTYLCFSYKKRPHDSQYGAQHPLIYGVLWLIVALDGEDVINCEPILGLSSIIK